MGGDPPPRRKGREGTRSSGYVFESKRGGAEVGERSGEVVKKFEQKKAKIAKAGEVNEMSCIVGLRPSIANEPSCSGDL
jgi:hypothetical protein